MTFKEQQDTLFEAVQMLMRLYQDIAGRTVPFQIIEGGKSNVLTFPTLEERKENCFVAFTEKEIQQMPNHFRKLLIIKKYRCRLRKRPYKDGFTYEIRLRSGGYNICAGGKTIELAKQNFIKKLQKIKAPVVDARQDEGKTPTKFHDFAMYFFENFRVKRIAEETYRKDMSRYNLYLLPAFGDKKIASITPGDCNELLQSITQRGKGKQAAEVFSLLSVIFKGAIAHGLIKKSPLDIVYIERHQRESGKALTKEEEVKLLAIEEEDFRRALALALYTGLRPNELKTARIEGDFIVANNSKRKNKKVEYKRIYICKRLRPFLEDGLPHLPTPQLLRRRVKAALPNHKLYDLRTTFYTRCQELGVALPALKHFVGHSFGTLGDTYTDLSQDYLLKEGQKLDLW